MKKLLGVLDKFDIALWLVSEIIVIISFFAVPEKNYVTLIASVIGATALIYTAKGHVFGQVMCVVFSVLYGIVSYEMKYYGEMITYLGMTAPIAVLSVISWLRNPYEGSREVEVRDMTLRDTVIMLVLTAIVTFIFYFILKTLGNASLTFSTLSVTTSFIASYMTFLRSPYYALGYAANDIVLIVLWVIAVIEDTSYAPMLACFAVFLINDLYGFVSWRKMRLRQGKA